MQKQCPWKQAVLAVLVMASVLIYSTLPSTAAALTDEEDNPGILLGAHIPPVDPSFGPNRLYYWQEIEYFDQLIGRRHPIIMYYGDLTSGFDSYLLDQLRDKVNPSPVPFIQMDPVPNIPMWDIANGLYDTQLRASALGAKRFGKPMIVGFAHEFNRSGTHYYGDPAAYIAAWRHVHNVFAQAGVTNVQWLWPPNYKSDRPYDPISDYNLYYPGDAYVDWIGVFGFNWGSDITKGPGWVEYDYLFDEFLRNTACKYDKPLMVGPTGSVEGPGSKTAWIANIYRAMANYPNLRAIVWLNEFAYGDPTQADFRVTVTSKYGAVPGPMPYYTAAYRNAISNPIYITEFPPYEQIKPSGKTCFTVDTAPQGMLLEWSDQAAVQVVVDQAPIFETPVSISVTGAPDGLRCTADPPTVGSGTADPTIELQATPGTPPGTYILWVSGEAEGMVQSTALTVAVVEKAYRTFIPIVAHGAAP